MKTITFFPLLLMIGIFCLFPYTGHSSDYTDQEQNDTFDKANTENEALLSSDSSTLYHAYRDKAESYKRSNQLDSTMHYYLKGLEIATQLKDSLYIINACNEISYVHYQLGDVEKSIGYIRKGYKHIEDTLSMEYLRFKDNEAAILNEWGKEEEAIKQYQYVLDKALYLNDSILIESASYNLAVIHVNLERDQTAFDYLEQLKRYTSNPEYLFNYHVLKANVFIAQEKYTLAQKEVDAARNYVKDMTDYLDVSDYYYTVAGVKVNLQETDSLMYFIDEILTYSDSSFYEDTRSEALLLESRYSSRIQRDSIQLLTQQKELHADSNRKKTTILLLLGLVLLACFLAALFYRKYYLNQKKLYSFLEESENQRTKLFTNLAHEIKTPLSLISGLTELVQKDKNISESTFDKINLIHQSSSKLLRSSAQLLEIAQNDFRDDQIKLSSLPFSAFLEEQLKEFDPRISYKHQELELHNTLPDSFTIHTDPEKLSTILTNLMDNAVKYTEVGGRIRIQLKKGENQQLDITITNTGIGIHKSDLPYLFDRFFRSKTFSDEGGFGIGLAIVKAYTDLLNGTIRVESGLGEKTSFFLRIPINTPPSEHSSLRKIEPEPLQKTGENAVENTAKLPKILIAEDTYDYCLYLDTVLSDHYHLVFVNNGKQALESLNKESFDLILTDWMMPEMDGISLIKAIKAHENHRELPILLLTAKNLKSDKIRALRVNADDYLEKSCSIELLLSTTKRLIGNKEKSEVPHFGNAYPKQVDINNENWLLSLEDIVLLSISDFDLSIDKIAQKMNLSSQQISRKIKAITGNTAKKYIQDIRFWEARKLLETREYDSVKSVCYQVGFKDPKNFSRNFKDRFGKYPSEFLQD